MCGSGVDHVVDCIYRFYHHQITGIIQELRNLIQFFSSFFRGSESYCIAKASLSFGWGSMFYGLVHIRSLHGAGLGVQYLGQDNKNIL